MVERWRARSLLSELAERRVLARELPAELETERRRLEQEYAETRSTLGSYDRTTPAGTVNEALARLHDLRRRQVDLTDKIRAAAPRLAALQYPKPLDLAGVRRTLDRGTLLLSYSVAEDRTLLFAVASHGGDAEQPAFDVFTLPVSRKDLRAKAEAFRNLVSRAPGRGEDRASLRAQGRELFDLLLRPARAQIQRAERLLILPDDALFTLPFSALVAEVDGSRSPFRYLIEWKPVHTLVSATLYAEVLSARHRHAPSSGRMALFADPLLHASPQAEMPSPAALRGHTTRSLEGFGPLPAARAEAREIARLFGGRAATYLGASATESSVRRLPAQTRVVHFATHAFTDERSPLQSALVLSPGDEPGSVSEDGLLEAWEIMEVCHTRSTYNRTCLLRSCMPSATSTASG